MHYLEIILKHMVMVMNLVILRSWYWFDIHEGPVLSKNTNDTVQVNNCVTIEPGIYVDGLGGVRIEDDILITENGCEVFTKCTKDLIIL